MRRFAEGRGLPLRRVAARFGVSRATVRRALNAPEPSPEHVIRRRPPTVIEPIQVLIDPMIDAGLLPKQIWDRLYDDTAKL
ncbi:helix-turn-helix domain-containing protein [Streptomyces sp. SM1]|uniref:helix-turn-helix domain-containing protein n=1 Tax=Streptomyces sp. SM1 TaxID=402229 RepID=UPI00215618E0|nr:helix-turn-helix domain-containing protein [Streptomyces sp. SM1]